MKKVNAMPFTNRFEYRVEEASMEDFLAAMQQREKQEAKSANKNDRPSS
jgi:hypothetical protein